jgi:predicted alpha/beta hydrolase
MREIHLTFEAADGHPLAGTCHEPSSPPIAAVLINGATGVPRRYYAAYARFLAQQGFAVLSYDYRGIGNSRFHAAKPAQLTMRNWGERDAAAALDHLHTRYPRLPLLAVGHSVGGQLLGLMPNHHKLAGAIGIAAQCGYWRLWPRTLQPRMAALWYLLIPALVALRGEVPRGVMGEALPAGVAREWARWCRHPDFIVDARGRALREHFENWRMPLRLYAIADDRLYAPQAAVERLASYFTRIAPELQVLQPRDLGVRAIGHFGFFRASMPKRAWQETADCLRGWVQPAMRRAA